MLSQVINYAVERKQRKEYRKLDAIEKEETRPGAVTVFQDDILVPAVPPTGLSRSKVIDINYELHVSASYMYRLIKLFLLCTHGMSFSLSPYWKAASIHFDLLKISTSERRPSA